MYYVKNPKDIHANLVALKDGAYMNKPIRRIINMPRFFELECIGVRYVLYKKTKRQNRAF